MQRELEPIVEAAKAAPPAGIIGLSLSGINLNDWVLVGSGVLILLQIFFLLREKVYIPWRKSHDRRTRRGAD